MKALSLARVGALLLFGAVQATMVITGLVRGEPMTPGQWLGLALALGGLAALVAPGVSAPPLLGTALMLAAGVAWVGAAAAGFAATVAGLFFSSAGAGSTTGNALPRFTFVTPARFRLSKRWRATRRASAIGHDLHRRE